VSDFVRGETKCLPADIFLCRSTALCAGQRLTLSASLCDTIRENPNKRLFDLDPSQKTLAPTDQLNPFD
jgi:hypothetical protein